jgi:hypothetical protein
MESMVLAAFFDISCAEVKAMNLCGSAVDTVRHQLPTFRAGFRGSAELNTGRPMNILLSA